jgi:hypothetical protein
MRVVGDHTRYDCHRCGEQGIDLENHNCPAELPFDGERCPMCGEPYDSYLTHLSRCEP